MKNSINISFKSLSVLLLGLLLAQNASAFCGFYVAKAGAELYNESSQVIMARDGNRSVITMANDFKGSVKDFAMVVPVPVILKEKDIKIADKRIFDRLDAYSSPRLVEYHDRNPCQIYTRKDYARGKGMVSKSMAAPRAPSGGEEKKNYGVTIEATYQVGEYDILILSAKESGGLERWLVDNGYKIPDGAKEVLTPYIKSDMKFFVVKVNLEEQKKGGFSYLRPLQISFESNKFMLPIRLGMANAKTGQGEAPNKERSGSEGFQDLIIYVFAQNGRVETTNYRTVKIPTDRNIPDFLKPHFPNFYKDLFERHWRNEGQNGVSLEYAWDLSNYNPVKCDPCVGTPPVVQDLKDAGVFWLTYNNTGYQGNVYITRLHARYNREKFPQDLFFQTTPNKERFQGRYVMRHAAKGNLDCDAGQEYLGKLVNNHRRELQELAALTGWDTDVHQGSYVNKYEKMIKSKKGQAERERNLLPGISPELPGGSGPGLLLSLLLLGVLTGLAVMFRFTRILRA